MEKYKFTGDKVNLARLPTTPDEPITDSKVKIKELQLKVLRQNRAFFRENRRAILVFEGMDAAGKGGAIRRLTRYLDPRNVHVWPIGAPEYQEKHQHYLQRFWNRLPAQGEISVFDRSWYGRVLVERVEGFAQEEEWQRAYREINEFEQMLCDDGMIVIKFFFFLSKDEQYQRLLARIQEPTKRWKLTKSDLISRRYWNQYHKAYEDMLNKTATKEAPWFLIPADDKRSARYFVLKIISDYFAKHVDTAKITLLSPDVATLAMDQFGKDVFKT